MGLPLWREPVEDAPRRSTTRSPAHPVIARSPIAHVLSPRHPGLSPRRRQVREARERRLRALSELMDNDDGETRRISSLRALFNNSPPSFEPDLLRDALHTYTPPSQDARALDHVVSYLTSREPHPRRDSPEVRDRERLTERSNPESASSEGLAGTDAADPLVPNWFETDDTLQVGTTGSPESPGEISQTPTEPSRPSSHLRRLVRPRLPRIRGGRGSRGSRGPSRNVDGLGDRDRSLSPEGDGLWDNLLTTLTPDPQPPSVGSSFASTNASTSASQNPTVASSRTSITSPGEPVEPPCDPVSDWEAFAAREWDRLNWSSSTRSNTEALEANPGGSSEDLAFISSMHAIIRRLASREDIPDEWWERAGLSRSMTWEGDN
ncbi:hypothetical protein F4805DRAFT_404829 [Annulohypoxylon moriforme]|nr:hypothetical protein F4805DRAFT_404829 [Annulohypoxylon moriforme]